MIEITYLDASKNERTVTFESYEDFDRSQQACLIGVAIHRLQPFFIFWLDSD